MPRPPKTHRVIANRCAGVCAIMRQRHIPRDATALLPPGPVDLDRTRDDGLVRYLPRSSQINPRSVYRGPKQKNVRGRSLAVPESAEPPPAHGFRGSGQDVPARASGRGVATNLPFAWVERKSVRRLPGASLRTGGRTRGWLGFVVKTQRLLLKYDRELTACVNRKYLHAINVGSDKRLGRTELGKRLFP